MLATLSAADGNARATVVRASERARAGGVKLTLKRFNCSNKNCKSLLLAFNPLPVIKRSPRALGLAGRAENASAPLQVERAAFNENFDRHRRRFRVNSPASLPRFSLLGPARIPKR